ncbi:hypothetical protein JRQ81_007266 [Phrynocephalus forsythii]|uniref:Threonylcarbamoyl-AMP synthase n=1 Tax=Phrynocephalus forsythii TaxID=171643 RepID=A0A9Q1AU19_9SAUR|nr:hypothetical protein JRQ81_007266 [Phrynocephalus forsythii]
MMASPESFAAVFYSEPAVLGLLANVASAFLVCLQNFASAYSTIQPTGVENILAGVHLILIGGLSQLLAGVLTFRKYDHLGGTAFLAFSSLWSSYGATRIILGAYPSLENATVHPSNASFLPSADPAFPSVHEGTVAGLVAYISISLILSFCSATVNYIMPFVFGAITLALAFEAVGLVARWALVVSGILELAIVACGLYGALALLFKGITQRYVLPGFGIPLFNVLLLGSSSRGASKNPEEAKKNTNYAEPMALNHLSDATSAFIFSFYALGYMGDFYVGAVWVSINAVGQILSSYYSYLRDDAYHATKSGVHSLYWLVMSWEEFTMTVSVSSENVPLSRAGMVGNWFFLATAGTLLVLSLNRDLLEVVHNSLFILLTASTIQQTPITGAHIFFGVSCVLYTATSLYATFAALINSIAEKALIPVGHRLLSSEKLQKVLLAIRACLRRCKDMQEPVASSEVPDALFYTCNGLAAFASLQGPFEDPVREHLSIPTILIPGTVFQLYVCRLQVQRGRRFGPVLPFCYAAVWATWTWLRFAGNLLAIDPRNDGGFTAGATAFLVINVFLMLLVVVLCVFSLTCLYGAAASLANCTFGRELLLLGPPLLKAEAATKEPAPPPPCICRLSHRTSSLRSIANKLNAGGVCGVPTDTVYALAASCKHPEAIETIYRIKDRPQEKPLCIFISNLDQLRAALPPFRTLLWAFMEQVYPGGVGCIVKKGQWLKKLGVGAGYDRVGTKDSIMVRVPDLTVLVHLINMTGPLAITSANPSGETDSTHHDMVITRLGHKLEGVLCDGESNEAVASTVVHCTEIDAVMSSRNSLFGVYLAVSLDTLKALCMWKGQGEVVIKKGPKHLDLVEEDWVAAEGIAILREGCVPTAKVMQIFEKVKNQMV